MNLFNFQLTLFVFGNAKTFILLERRGLYACERAF